MSISTVWSIDGSLMVTGWNCARVPRPFRYTLRYSAKVVASMTRISLRDRAGFKMFAAFIAPSESPAPTMECTSSMTRMILPSFLTSLIDP